MDKILITGATGFVGKNLIEKLNQFKSYSYFAFVDKNDKNGIEYLKQKNIGFITEDELENYSGHFDFCVHLASYGVAYGARNIDTMIDVNIKLTSKLADFCSKHGCRLFLNTGSCFEYGSQIKDRPINELDPLMPDDIYAASKVACETFLKVYSKIVDLKIITIRPFSIYGKYENSSRLMPLLFDSGTKNKKLELTAGQQVRDYMDVRDVADAIIKIIDNNEKTKDGEAINICSGAPLSLKEFISFVINNCSFNPDLFIFGAKEYRQNESMYFVGDNTRLFEIIGKCDYSISPAKIKDCYDFYLANIKSGGK